MAAIILTSGILGVTVMGNKGSLAMDKGMDKLALLGIFGDEVVNPTFNSSWYHPSMNVSAEDVNSPSDFVFVLNPDGTTYTLSEYKNTSDKDVVIPEFHTDGKMITGIGEYSFQTMGLTSVALHNSINVVGDYAFSGNKLTSLSFNGAKPSLYRYSMFSNNPSLTAGTVKVPSAYLTSYQASFNELGFSASNVIVGY